MIMITQKEKDWLIEKGYIKSVKGKYEGLIVCNKEHKSRNKTYYTLDSNAYYLRYRHNKTGRA